MKGRESKGPPSADLLACFPSRAHLALMPKAISSPARPNEPNKRHPHHHRSKSLSRGGASPLPWARPRAVGPEMSSEPTSPKVTCAGQIKVVRPKTTACKNWQSVMEEIERIHNDKKNKKRRNWVEAFGLKKDVVNFLSCLRRVKFDFRCFGTFPNSEIDSDNEEEDEEDEDHLGENSKAVFSKWFMVLQEEQSKNKEKKVEDFEKQDVFENSSIQVPPPNALLLMRCRSAPAKSWLEEREEEGREKEGKKKRTSLEMVMKCDDTFHEANNSLDVVKEDWISEDMRDYLTRIRSSKR